MQDQNYDLQDLLPDSHTQNSRIQQLKQGARSNAYNTRKDRQRRAPYDTQRSQATRQMELCSYYDQNKQAEDSRNQPSLLQKIGHAIKEKVMGLGEIFLGSQRSTVSDRNEGRPALRQYTQMEVEEVCQNSERQYIDLDDLSVPSAGFPSNMPKFEFSFLHSPVEQSREQTCKRVANANSTTIDCAPHQSDIFHNSDKPPRRRPDSPVQQITFQNFHQVEKDNLHRLEKKFNSTWTKFNMKQFKSQTIAGIKLKPSFLDSVKLVIRNSTKDVATIDNRNIVYGLMKLRGGHPLFKPLAKKPLVNENDYIGKRKRTFEPKRPGVQQINKLKKIQDEESGLTQNLQVLRQQTQDRQIKDDIMKAISKEDLDAFKKGVLSSRNTAQETQDSNNLEKFVDQQVLSIHKKMVQNEIRKTKSRIAQSSTTEEERKRLHTVMRELQKTQELLVHDRMKHEEEIKKQGEEMKEQQSKFQEVLQKTLNEIAEKTIEAQKMQQLLVQSQSQSQQMQISQSQEQHSRMIVQELTQSFEKKVEHINREHLKKAEEMVRQMAKLQEEVQKLTVGNLNRGSTNGSDNPNANPTMIVGTNKQVEEKKSEKKELALEDLMPSPQTEKIGDRPKEKALSFGIVSSEQRNSFDQQNTLQKSDSVGSFKSEQISTPTEKGSSSHEQKLEQKPQPAAPSFNLQPLNTPLAFKLNFNSTTTAVPPNPLVAQTPIQPTSGANFQVVNPFLPNKTPSANNPFASALSNSSNPFTNSSNLQKPIGGQPSQFSTIQNPFAAAMKPTPPPAPNTFTQLNAAKPQQQNNDSMMVEEVKTNAKPFQSSFQANSSNFSAPNFPNTLNSQNIPPQNQTPNFQMNSNQFQNRPFANMSFNQVAQQNAPFSANQQANSMNFNARPVGNQTNASANFGALNNSNFSSSSSGFQNNSFNQNRNSTNFGSTGQPLNNQNDQANSGSGPAFSLGNFKKKNANATSADDDLFAPVNRPIYRAKRYGNN